jgi:hypothetical protein
VHTQAVRYSLISLELRSLKLPYPPTTNTRPSRRLVAVCAACRRGRRQGRRERIATVSNRRFYRAIFATEYPRLVQ